MNRLLYDLSKWNLMLHRSHRELPAAAAADAPQLQLEDEVFERLYAGGADPALEPCQDPAIRAWAQQMHQTLDGLPAFSRLQQQCLGDAAAAAAAVGRMADEGIFSDPKTPKDPQGLRRALGRAAHHAAKDVDDLQEFLDAFAGVSFGTKRPDELVTPDPLDQAVITQRASRLRSDQRLQRIAFLAGRFKRIAATKRRTRVRHGADEITDVEQGADLGRLLPSELVQLTHPKLHLLFLRDLLERQTLQYQLRGLDTLGRGPLVLLLDKSSSMEGSKDEWATATALALLDHAHAEGRAFCLITFSDMLGYEAEVLPHQQLPHDALFVPASGGTDIHAVLTRGLDLVAKHNPHMKRADLILISDGESDSSKSEEIKRRAQDLRATIYGLAIGTNGQTSSLQPWCDHAAAVTSIGTLEEPIAAGLFDGGEP